MIRRLFLPLSILAVFVCTSIVTPELSRAASSTIVISEFRTRGPSGGNDEFIELYNLSASPVSIGGWQVKGSNSSGTVSTRAIINSDTVINPGCYYLITNSNDNGGPYSGVATSNQTYSTGITDDGGIALTMTDGSIVDQVGMSSGSVFKEGIPLDDLTSNTNQSYQRRLSGVGIPLDTDNNRSDFTVVTSNPQNASASCITSTEPPPPEPQPNCGVERWSVKTGTDVDAKLVDLTTLHPTTIAVMRTWPAPSPIPLNNRVAPYETSVWVVNATLTDYKLEEDSDYHLVLRDEAGNTFIAEIPCACCVGALSPFRDAIAEVRHEFDARYIATDQFKMANVAVRVSGVGMFDFLHGQRGVAPNGIELHPLLSITFNVDLRKPVIVSVSVSGKKLLVSGLSFREGAKIYLNGEKQKTALDEESGGTILVGKKAGKLISRGETVTIIVRSEEGVDSAPFIYRRPE